MGLLGISNERIESANDIVQLKKNTSSSHGPKNGREQESSFSNDPPPSWIGKFL
jgi:hypothetical protein